MNTVVFSFVFDKYSVIKDKLGSKDLSRKLQTNCAISYYFYLYLMLHVCAAKFDVTRNLNFFAKIFGNSTRLTYFICFEVYHISMRCS
jgi:hypothetical protein